VASSDTQLATDQVALFLALGGGWESSHGKGHGQGHGQAHGEAHADAGHQAPHGAGHDVR
jgi:hypothetical protein